MKTHGLTTQQKEREHASCYGRYDETTNSWLEICDLTDYGQCESCGFWFYADEIHRTDEGEILCDYHYEICREEKREELEMYNQIEIRKVS